ncbi:MAG: hypothetical protein WAU91_22715, partial [Desulfatitalea sp.]
MNSRKHILVAFVAVLLLLQCSAGVFAGVPFETTVQEPYYNLLDSLKNDKDPNIKLLLIKWENYIESVSTYS